MRTLLLFCAALVLGSAVSLAKAPQKGGQAPGWFRFKVGDFEVTALSDGTAEMPMDQILTNIKPDKVKAAFAAAKVKLPVENSVNAFLVNTGDKLVLIDTGAGKPSFAPTVGRLLANLKASGYEPAQVDEIYLTHMHADHSGGLLVDGKVAFPNAVVRTAKAESDFWLDPKVLETAPDDRKPMVAMMQAALKPYVAAGKHKPFEGADVELVPGVRALGAAGHSPGHTVYAIESKGEKLVFWGDLMHVAAVQFGDPNVAIQFDSDQKGAIAARKKLFAEAAAKGYRVAGAHISFPGVGYVKTEGRGYAWIPMGYTRN